MQGPFIMNPLQSSLVLPLAWLWLLLLLLQTRHGQGILGRAPVAHVLELNLLLPFPRAAAAAAGRMAAVQKSPRCHLDQAVAQRGPRVLTSHAQVDAVAVDFVRAGERDGIVGDPLTGGTPLLVGFLI